jgi:hypothetical protein
MSSFKETPSVLQLFSENQLTRHQSHVQYLYGLDSIYISQNLVCNYKATLTKHQKSFLTKSLNFDTKFVTQGIKRC